MAPDYRIAAAFGKTGWLVFDRRTGRTILSEVTGKPRRFTTKKLAQDFITHLLKG